MSPTRADADKTTTAALRLSQPDEGEELARAELYGLLAALYHAPPTPGLYEQLQMAVTEAPSAGAFLEGAWGSLVAAARRLTVTEVEAEYQALFGGVGRPEIFLNASWHLAGHLNQKPLADLRQDLATLGLERSAAATETEDHLASLCEVMRYLIAGDDLGVSHLANQQRFFAAHLQPWVEGLCELLQAHPRADFYRELAGLTRDFLAVERQAFELLDAG